MNNLILGKNGEDLAIAYLKNSGYRIIERNFRIRGGEIDVIALDGEILVYIEVKTRTSHQFGLPEESVGYHKIKFLERAAKFYRANRTNLRLPEPERIDVVAVDLSEAKPKIDLIRNITQ